MGAIDRGEGPLFVFRPFLRWVRNPQHSPSRIDPHRSLPQRVSMIGKHVSERKTYAFLFYVVNMLNFNYNTIKN